MDIKTAVGAALIGFFCSVSVASAIDTASRSTVGHSKKNFESEFGKTLPPVGYIAFCKSDQEECKASGAQDGKLAMSPDRWSLLNRVNAYVNSKIAPVSDQDLYGEAERWAYPTDAGDCEDYVLLKKRYLEGLGFTADNLLITVVLDEKGEGHAILTVTTDGGDFILDNRRDEVLRWSDTNYKFLKRQSHGNPLQWVALVKQETSNSGFVSGNNSR